MSNRVYRTHDTSFADCHIENIEELGADLNEAVQAAWPKRHSIRYSQVNALLISWDADDLEVHLEIEPLRRVFEDRYHFNVQDYKIPSVKPDKALKKRIFDFLDHDENDTLLIVYYAGHARCALQSNEASLWCANRDDPYLVVPSGGIQSMLEEADADVVLLCDCCHSTAIPTTDSQQRNNKVMEAITACGYETRAAQVGDHSFTNALTYTLAIASKGLPFTISELHARVVSKLKCWAPELVKSEDGNYVDTAENRLLFERQHRRTPIFTVVCRTNPTRSIVLAPLGKVYPSPSESGGECSSLACPETLQADMSSSQEWAWLSNSQSLNGECRKRKRPVDDDAKFPFVLLSAKLDKCFNKQAWVEWVRNAPIDAKHIHIEGAYASFSTLVLLRIPVSVWNLLPENAAYTFVGYVCSGNYVTSDPTDSRTGCPCGNGCGNSSTEGIQSYHPVERPNCGNSSTEEDSFFTNQRENPDPDTEVGGLFSRIRDRLPGAGTKGVTGTDFGPIALGPSASEIASDRGMARMFKSLKFDISAKKWMRGGTPSEKNLLGDSLGPTSSLEDPSKDARTDLGQPPAATDIGASTPIYASRSRIPELVSTKARSEQKGWWKCCQDGREVDPYTWGENCPDDDHKKCFYCTPL